MHSRPDSSCGPRFSEPPDHYRSRQRVHQSRLRSGCRGTNGHANQRCHPEVHRQGSWRKTGHLVGGEDLCAPAASGHAGAATYGAVSLPAASRTATAHLTRHLWPPTGPATALLPQEPPSVTHPLQRRNARIASGPYPVSQTGLERSETDDETRNEIASDSLGFAAAARHCGHCISRGATTTARGQCGTGPRGDEIRE